ncbi:MAG: lysophospholipid acyltransferase family protein [Bacteroidota bacterium]
MNTGRRLVVTVYVWITVSFLIIFWFLLLLIIRATDTDPVRYRTGRWFRRLGVAMTKVNPFWRVELSGEQIGNPRNPYVVVSNHQSLADIPIISYLPWEMKWVAKQELFKLPFVGWMMKLAGDIPLDRADRRSGARMLAQAERSLAGKCSVMVFPEGTRSLDGRVRRFNDGAFYLALKARVPVLPIAVDGSHACLPKHSVLFGDPARVTVRVLKPVETSGLTIDQVEELKTRVRSAILDQLALWRGTSAAEVDGMS